jgi:hypothetical protein
MARKAEIIQGLESLVETKVILSYADMGDRWIIQTRGLQYYFTNDEARAFIEGALSAVESDYRR